MKQSIIIDNISFELRPNPRRKNISVGITSEGTYYIALPNNLSQNHIHSLLDGKVEKVTQSLMSKTAHKAVHSYLDGDLFYLEGKTYPLHYDHNATHKYIKFTGTNFTIACKNKDEAKALLEMFYKNYLREKLKITVPFFAKKVGVTPNEIHVKNVKTIWGSCSSKQNLNFSLRLAMVPPKLLEYVVVHELCHLKEMNHSPAFHREVEKIIPNARLIENRLKEESLRYIL